MPEEFFKASAPNAYLGCLRKLIILISEVECRLRRMLKVYIDNCVFNRPFDDQHQIRIKLETEAKLFIQGQNKQQRIALIWSYILEMENAHNPFLERRLAICQWQTLPQMDISETETVLQKAHVIQTLGLKSKDALHIACAIEARANYFITTDDSIIRKIGDFSEMKVVYPIDFIACLEGRK